MSKRVKGDPSIRVIHTFIGDIKDLRKSLNKKDWNYRTLGEIENELEQIKQEKFIKHMAEQKLRKILSVIDTKYPIYKNYPW